MVILYKHPLYCRHIKCKRGKSRIFLLGLHFSLVKRRVDQRCKHFQVTFHILGHNGHHSEELFPKLSHQFLPNDTSVIPEASCQGASITAVPNNELDESIGRCSNS